MLTFNSPVPEGPNECAALGPYRCCDHALGAELEQFKLLLVYEFKPKTFYVQSLPRSGLAKPLHCTSGECNGDYKDGGMSVHGYVYSEKRV